MGDIERNYKVKAHKENLQKLILETVAAAGVLAVCLVAPNVLKSMSVLGIIPKHRQKEYVSSSAAKLVKKGLMEFRDGYYQLTVKGGKVITLWELTEYKLRKPETWDKKWRIIIYDIPEKRKGVIRKQIFNVFKQAGFYRLQNSVWVYPYDCEDLIGLLKTELGAGKDVLYIIADEIENDRHLRSNFGLR